MYYLLLFFLAGAQILIKDCCCLMEIRPSPRRLQGEKKELNSVNNEQWCAPREGVQTA